MKAVTLIQPVAALVVLGACRLEVRAWRTSHRGRVAVYASRAFPHEAREVSSREPVRSALRAALGHDDWRRLPLGALLGTVELLDCRPVEDERLPGGWAWLLEDAEPLAEPIPYRGHLGIFEVPDDLFQPEFEIRLSARRARRWQR
jgi:activating signal cointegrator 1